MPHDRDSILRHLTAAYQRAERARVEAQRILDAGVPSAALVWAVRSAEILLRDYVLTPHFLEQGLHWDEAMRKGSKILGDSKWPDAFAKAEEWYGPFDEPLTEDNEKAWKTWVSRCVRRRGDIVHGKKGSEAGTDEAAEAIAFAERMATWYSQRFLTSSRHPINQGFRDSLGG